MIHAELRFLAIVLAGLAAISLLGGCATISGEYCEGDRCVRVAGTLSK
jgi:hypothetical protein